MTVDCEGTLQTHCIAQAESVTFLRHAVVDFAIEAGASQRQREDIALAVSEALSNAVLHAYAGRADPGLVAVHAWTEARGLNVVICDDGVGMRARTDSPGLGLGMKLIEQMTERLVVTRRHPGVRLQMRFAIG